MKEELMKKINEGVQQGAFRASWDSLEQYQIPEWYQDAKFGIFIHWGVYSVPAFGNEWYPRNMYDNTTREYQYHLDHFGKHKDFGYKDFIPMFKAEHFDADAWAELFAEAGAKYVVPVAEHHDGFQMYDSALSKWNAVQMGPKRDVIGELSKSIRDKGMYFGVSSHRVENWFYYDHGMDFDSDVRDPRFRDFYGPAHQSQFNLEDINGQADEAFLEDWLMRTCELVDKYQPQILYFDWWIQNLCVKPFLKKFAAYYYNRGKQWDKGVAINYKHGAFPEGAAVYDVERGQLSGMRSLFWQTCTSVSKSSWGYTEKQNYKQAEEIICDLVDIVSKNGTLLLNVGPKPDGTIPAEEQEILRRIGKWLGIYGEAIYGTRPFKIYGEGPTKIEQGAFTDGKTKCFTGDDIRFTTKGNCLYVIVLQLPEDGKIAIKSLGKSQARLKPENIKEVEVVGETSKVSWSWEDDALHVNVPLSQHGFQTVALRISL